MLTKAQAGRYPSQSLLTLSQAGKRPITGSADIVSGWEVPIHTATLYGKELS